MNPNSARKTNGNFYTKDTEPQKITHVDGEYELIAFKEVKSGDTLRIEYPTVIPTTTGPLLVTSHVDLHMIDEVLLQPINNNGHESVIHAFPKGHGKKIYRLIPALPTEAGSLIQIWKVSNYFNPLPSGTLAQLFIGKFGLPHWGYLDHNGIQHDIDSECIDKWTQVYLTTTPNA